MTTLEQMTVNYIKKTYLCARPSRILGPLPFGTHAAFLGHLIQNQTHLGQR